MPALRKLQEGFVSAVFGADPPPALLECIDTREPAKAVAGLAAYRRSVLTNLAAAVNISYPVVGAIVGDEFMEVACRRYARDYPSTSGDLNLYGDQFAAFLAGFAPAQSLPYLPDVARLEWLVQTVSGAADAPDQDLHRLADTAPEEWGLLTFLLDPAHATLASMWPVVRIWQVNQPQYEGAFEVDFDQGQSAMVRRIRGGTTVSAISAAERAFVAALSTPCTLDGAVSAACSVDGNFALSDALARFIGDGLLRRVV